MEIPLRVFATVVCAYALGSIPFAVIVGKIFWGEDIRDLGSGNAGATNVLRVFGPAPGFGVLGLDAAKGAAAVALASVLAPAQWGATGRDWMLIAAAFVAIAGHSFSPFLGFSGGKGVATAAGGILIVAPTAVAILAVTFVIVVAIWKMVSLGSVVIAAVFPFLMAALYPSHPALTFFAGVAAVLVIWRHRANIGRIIHGEEAKITFKRRMLEDIRNRRKRGDD